MAFNFQGGPALAGGVPQGQLNILSGPTLMTAGMLGPGMMAGMMPGFQMTGQMALVPPESQTLVNPGLNDAPLEFNTAKNKPPLPITGSFGTVATGDIDERSLGSMTSQFSSGGDSVAGGEMTKERETGRRRGGGSGTIGDRNDRNRKDPNGRHKDHINENNRSHLRDSMDKDDHAASEDGGASGSETIGSGAPVWPGLLPSMPYQMMGMPLMDPNIIIPQFGMMGGMGIGQEAPEGILVKEVIQLKSVTLIPPPPGTPLPTTRERPPGCKTIFVGGLAENTTEEIIHEIFSRCGEMLTVRLSNKKFCHIRFAHESSVDGALYFSGYRMRIENKNDPPNTGRLHVDFAQARDDQYEWECKQRQLQREARHRDRVEKERLRVPSPPPVPHYTEHEATSVSERIKGEDSFGKAVQVVITWLERGDCSKRNASVFYSMIQSTNSHIRRLLSEKATHEEELQKAKDLMKARMQSLLLQFAQIERVFMAASHKKVWDHFTKAQRKNIEMWKKQAAEIKAIELEEHLNSGGDDEMDFSEEDDGATGTGGGPKKKMKLDDRVSAIKEENDSLRCQLEAYKNEVDLVRTELRIELEATENKLKMSQQTVHALQQQLSEAKLKESMERGRIMDLEEKLSQAQDSLPSKEEDSLPPVCSSPSSQASTQVQSVISESEARLISLISVFLHVHPFGAGVDYIWSYVQKLEPGIRPSDIETLLGRFPSLFQQELSGIGANMERKWVVSVFIPKNEPSQ